MFAVDAASGKILWSFDPSNSRWNQPSFNNRSVSYCGDGMVFYGAWSDHVRA